MPKEDASMAASIVEAGMEGVAIRFLSHLRVLTR